MTFRFQLFAGLLFVIVGCVGLAISRPLLSMMGLGALAFVLLGTVVIFLSANHLRGQIESLGARLRSGRVPDEPQSFEELEQFRDRIHRLVGEKEHALAQCRARQDQLDAVVEGLAEALVVVDEDRRILMANPAMQRLLEPVGNLTGRKITEVMRHPEIFDAFDRALENLEPGERRIDDTSKSGRIFDLHTTPLEGEYARIAGIFIDVTRLESLESVRQQFVANVSHELRTPLASIRASVETLQQDGFDDVDQAQRFVDIIARHAARMGALIEDLTDLSRIESGAIRLEPCSIELEPLVRKVAADLSTRHAALDVRVDLDVPPGMTIWADRRRLEQVLVNLVENAIKFNSPGGHVHVFAREEGGKHKISVRDSGPGIPAQSLDKIFHRFFRVDEDRSRERGGTGLGLAIVKHLVQLHGGRVSVKSELGKGSEFVVELPEQGSVPQEVDAGD